MGFLVDELASLLATPMPRRRTLRLAGGLLGGAAVSAMGLRRTSAAAQGDSSSSSTSRSSRTASQCLSDSDCDSSHFCCNGQCQPKCGASQCLSDSDCNNNPSNQTSYFCCNGVCQASQTKTGATEQCCGGCGAARCGGVLAATGASSSGGWTLCNGTCTQLTCGNAGAPDLSACSCTCSSGQCIETDGSTVSCVPTCSGGRTCQSGTCACPTGQILCSTTCVTGTCCTDADCTGSTYCDQTSHTCQAEGGPGTACSENDQCTTSICTNGVCACPSGSVNCSGTCVTGTCCTDTDCRAGDFCSNHACQAAGGPGSPCMVKDQCLSYQCINNTCACTASSQCLTGEICRNGECARSCTTTSQCPSGQTCQTGACQACSGTICDGACVDTTTDPANCGVCGKVCSGGQTCSNKQCACPTGQALCPSEVFNPASNMYENALICCSYCCNGQCSSFCPCDTSLCFIRESSSFGSLLVPTCCGANQICLGPYVGCADCGDEQQPCCTNGSRECSDSLTCFIGKCLACGTTSWPCCGGTSCSDGLVCSNGVCIPCGFEGQLCCSNDLCADGLTCTGICNYCVGLLSDCKSDEECCSGRCRGGLCRAL